MNSHLIDDKNSMYGKDPIKYIAVSEFAEIKLYLERLDVFV